MAAKNESITRLAKATSNKGQHCQHKVGAVIVKKGRPISTGFNSYKTHPLIHKKNPLKTTHAEISAISRTKDRESLAGATIYVFREHRDGSMAMARPCPCCWAVCQEHGIKDVYYTTETGEWEYEKF